MTDEQQAQASLLELERYGLCENCHSEPATEIFDTTFVCSPCRRFLDKRLVKDG